jgi:type I site-specific restriction endonuclease
MLWYLILIYLVLGNPRQIIIEEKGVPEMFFDDNFNLSNLSTFNQVFPEDAMAASLLLQEKLTHYLDEVEVMLFKQVTNRSNSIFDALMQYSELNNELCTSLPYITSLRNKIKDLQDVSVKQPLSVSQLMRKRENSLNLQKKIEAIAIVQHNQRILKSLISNSDYVKAINLIESTQSILRTELSSMNCLKNLANQLKEYLTLIEKTMQQEFVNITIECNIEELQDIEGIKNTMLYSRLTPVIYGLIRMNHIQPALENYRDQLIHYAKEKIKETLEESLEKLPFKVEQSPRMQQTHNQPLSSKRTSSNLNLSPTDNQQLTLMTHEEFLPMVCNIFLLLCKQQFSYTFVGI